MIFKLMNTAITERSATFANDGMFRNTLLRMWDPSLPRVVFIMLNPSTADAEKDDQTIRTLIAFAQLWGYGSLMVVNLFTLRATDPKEMKKHPCPQGPDCERSIEEALDHPSTTLCVLAWGQHGSHLGQDRKILDLIMSRKWRWHMGVKCFGRTKAGFPKHPLYLRRDTKLEDWIFN